MDRTGSGSYLVVGFGVSGFKPSDSVLPGHVEVFRGQRLWRQRYLLGANEGCLNTCLLA